MILLGLSLLLALMSSNSGYIAGIFGVATLHMLLASYLWRQVYAQLAASIMTLIALTALSWMINLEAAWRPLFIGGAGATLRAGMSKPASTAAAPTSSTACRNRRSAS